MTDRLRRRPRPVLLVSGALVAIALLLVGALTAFRASDVRAGHPSAAATPPPRVDYAALGDSYSAGIGAEPNDGRCGRSTRAYPALWAAAHRPDSFRFLACSGADTGTVADQVAELAPNTTLISLTAGGNDVGFSDVMIACSLEVLRCAATVKTARQKVQNDLPGALDRLYATIAARAPHARVVVLGYPAFYDVHAAPCPGVLDSNRDRINDGIDLLDQTLAAAAGRHHFVFADPRPAFSDHEICSGHDWLHAVDLSNLAQSYHPTADGQRSGYLPTFAASSGVR